MGGNVLSTLSEAAEESRGDESYSGGVGSWFAWAGFGMEAHEDNSRGYRDQQGGQRRTSRSRARQDVPQTAFEANEMYGDIDTTKVDIGALAPRILAAQQPIPVRRARPVRRQTNAHDCYVRVMVWDPFRDFLISGGGDGWIRIWSISDYTLQDEIDARHSVRALLVLTSSLVSGHNNGEVQIWDLERAGCARLQSLRVRSRSRGHSQKEECVYALAMLRSGELVAGAETICIYSRSTNGMFEFVRSINEDILCICALPPREGISQVVAGNQKGTLSVWSVLPPSEAERWRLIERCEAHSKSVWSLAFIREKQLMASGGADKAIRLWSTESWTLKHELLQHAGWVVGLSVGPGWLLSSSVDKTVMAWDVSRWHCERAFDDHGFEAFSVCAFAGGRFAVGGGSKDIVIYGGPLGLEDRDERERANSRPAEPAGLHDSIRLRHQQLEPREDQREDGQRPSRGSVGSGGGALVGGAAGAAGAAGAGAAGAAGYQQEEYGRRGGGGGSADRWPERRREDEAADDDLLFETKRAVPKAPALVGGPGGFEIPAAAPGYGDDLDFETRVAVPRFNLEEPTCPKYEVGGPALVWSASSGRWLPATVLTVAGGTVTVLYRLPDGGEAQKQLLESSENLRPS